MEGKSSWVCVVVKRRNSESLTTTKLCLWAWPTWRVDRVWKAASGQRPHNVNKPYACGPATPILTCRQPGTEAADNNNLERYCTAIVADLFTGVLGSWLETGWYSRPRTFILFTATCLLFCVASLPRRGLSSISPLHLL